MSNTPHDLYEDFPEKAEAIHALKAKDALDLAALIFEKLNFALVPVNRRLLRRDLGRTATIDNAVKRLAGNVQRRARRRRKGIPRASPKARKLFGATKAGNDGV